MAANGSCAEGSSRARFGLLALMLMMMMMMLFVSAVNWKRSPSLPARAGLAFGAASRSSTLIQDDDAYDDDDDDDRKWKDDYDGEDDGPQLPQVSPQVRRWPGRGSAAGPPPSFPGPTSAHDDDGDDDDDFSRS